MDGGSSIHGISQARVLEWVAIAFSILETRLSYSNIYEYWSHTCIDLKENPLFNVIDLPSYTHIWKIIFVALYLLKYFSTG